MSHVVLAVLVVLVVEQLEKEKRQRERKKERKRKRKKTRNFVVKGSSFSSWLQDHLRKSFLLLGQIIRNRGNKPT
jgi:hypothetical protein